jgi:hypothetical protein
MGRYALYGGEREFGIEHQQTSHGNIMTAADKSRELNKITRKSMFYS